MAYSFSQRFERARKDVKNQDQVNFHEFHWKKFWNFDTFVDWWNFIPLLHIGCVIIIYVLWGSSLQSNATKAQMNRLTALIDFQKSIFFRNDNNWFSFNTCFKNGQINKLYSSSKHATTSFYRNNINKSTIVTEYKWSMEFFWYIQLFLKPN